MTDQTMKPDLTDDVDRLGDETKRAAREVEEKAKETWRRSDGDESLADKAGNLGDDIRQETGNLGDEVREGVDELDDREPVVRP
jgi:hypothetical protein